MSVQNIEDFLFSAILGVILGGRIGYVLFYQPGDYFQNPQEILMLWTGGMSFHGGLLGVVVASFLFARRHDIAPRQMADAVALATPPGLFLGRLANFANAELWGRPTDLPWGVVFPGQAAQDCDDVVIGYCARHPSQLYEAALEGLVLGVVILFMIRAGALRKPGYIAGVFFVGYGVSRFIVEFFRQPDPQFVSTGNPLGLAVHFEGYGLTMGQLLTLPMVLIGLFLIISARKKSSGESPDCG
jgi:phosphatidylglycerol:prolipoprotein diacylglycerol transferase